MSIAFDDGIADALIRVLERTDDDLSGQGRWRYTAAGQLAEDFAGPAAEAFFAACQIEARDRGTLARVLYELAVQVRDAKRKASQERERRAELAAWEVREDQRRADRAADPVRAHDPGATDPDPRPSEMPVLPPLIEAEFRARERPRALGDRGGTYGMVSADPAKLRRFVRGATDANADLGAWFRRVRVAWLDFEHACGWVRHGQVSFLPGFDSFCSWNADDAVWVGKIADAFEAAGSGTLSGFHLTLQVGNRQERAAQARRLLLDGKLTVDQVAVAWRELEASPAADTDALLKQHPDWFGQLDGLPALARARANQYRVPGLLDAAKTDLAEVLAGKLDGGTKRAQSLRHEIAYLERAKIPLGEKGGVQLYLYDRENSRIIEMFGTPGPGTLRAVTYVPGTFTSMDSFYTGGVQQIAQHLAANLPGTVAFVYKDGLFPGEDTAGGEPNPGRIGEANDPDFAREAGKQLARFAQAMRADPNLGGADQIGIGHSWGLANLTGSETRGAHYDTVISLSGAGMLPGWKPGAQTGYFDLSYDDALQRAQREGYAWKDNHPRKSPAFTKLPYYQGPDDAVLRDGSVRTLKDRYDVLMENHNLIAKVNKANWKAVEDMRKLVGA